MSDVVICGGGLAGLCLARQLKRDEPELAVTVVEKTTRPLPDGTHKVGESSVELGSHYFGVHLGLDAYLRERHLIKNGLRFFPGGGATHALAERTEIGPPQLPVVPSYQLDRGRFENDLRLMCEEDGVAFVEGVAVTDVELGEPHEVHLDDGRRLQARWVVDATGRRRLLSRKLGLGRPSGHTGHAAWFRVNTRIDVDELVSSTDTDWHRRDLDGIRWLSTSHLMGEGYWVWIIPLSTGLTSIGIVVHDEVHPFDTIRTLERAQGWLRQHETALAEKLEPLEIADFKVARDYSYTAERCFSADRWALVGEAGLFVDPFYSPGSDFIALANSYVGELIRADRAEEPLSPRAEFTDWFYRRLAKVACLTYADAAATYGRPRVMAAKIYWDNFNYWSFVCQYYIQGLYRLPLADQRDLVPLAERWASLNTRGQALLGAWGRRAADAPVRRHVVMPPIPSVLANLHLDLEKEMSLEETRAYMESKAELAEELLTELLLRALQELSPEAGADLVEEVGAAEWPLLGLAARIEAERGGRRGRRKRLSRLIRDLERTIGPAESHPDNGDLEAVANHGLRVAFALPAE